MSDVLVTIEKAVPITIFEVPEIKLRVDTLFDKMVGDIKSRFDEVKGFITKTETDKKRYGEISYDEIASWFKIYFYKSILNEVVEIMFSKEGKYDVIAIILELLSDEKLREAILGKPMIDAFKDVMRKIPSDGGLPLLGSKMILMDKEFLGIPYSG